MAERSIYRRKPFDPARHCGHAKDRSEDSFRRKVAEFTEFIAELEALSETRELAPTELKRLQRKRRRLQWAKVGLEKIEKYGPDDRPCMNLKGNRTTHPGVGLCSAHCECKGRQNWHLEDKFQYSRRTKDKQLRQIMDRMESAQTDLTDMSPELLLLKAKVQMFVDVKTDFEPETIKSLATLTEQIGKNIERVNNKKFQSMIAIDVFQYAMHRMGEVVADKVKDQEILDQIMSAWDRINLDLSNKKRGAIASGMSQT